MKKNKLNKVLKKFLIVSTVKDVKLIMIWKLKQNQ